MEADKNMLFVHRLPVRYYDLPQELPFCSLVAPEHWNSGYSSYAGQRNDNVSCRPWLEVTRRGETEPGWPDPANIQLRLAYGIEKSGAARIANHQDHLGTIQHVCSINDASYERWKLTFFTEKPTQWKE